MENLELQKKIRILLKERKGILLAHNYQRPEVQDIADFTGDSLGLSIEASRTDAELIVFCGVHFMAETASIICPDKTVLLPRLDAGCPMADMITPEALKAKKETLPGLPVVTYVNSTAAVKALSTICCTSANAVSVVNSLPEEEILMTPDKNLALYTQRYSQKKIYYWEGYCPTHQMLTAEDIKNARSEHPEALFMAHPECRPEVIDLADAVRSTSGMLKFARESDHQAFIVGTETGILYPLSKENPGKKFYPALEAMICPNMKRTRLPNVLEALKENKHIVKVPEDIRVRAFEAVSRMLEVSRSEKN